MNLNNLEKVLAEEPAYRLKQARQAVYKNFISDWSEATFLPKDLRQKLNKECPLEIKADTLVSKKENSVKARIILGDGLKIESVLMQHQDGRNTVCVSSQVGCPLGCLFCATGKMGFKRNLTVDEILEQVIFFERYIKNLKFKIKNYVTNVTFMGMGEPFLNYDNVMKSIKILNTKEYFNISARSISVSTSGIIEGIEKFTNEGLQLNLAISLHAPNNKLREFLMPINKKYPLRQVLVAVDEYIKKTNRKVMFEYVLIDGVNDSDECAEELAKLMARKLYFLNLILYNPTDLASASATNFSPMQEPALPLRASRPGSPKSLLPRLNFKPSSTAQVKKLKAILEKAKVNFVQRYRFGDDIQAACGQFATSK